MTQRCASNIIVRTQVKRSICFLDRAKQEVSPGAARDGFTAFQKTNDASPFTVFRKTNAIHALYGVPENKCDLRPSRAPYFI
jgi:hypothetical protein